MNVSSPHVPWHGDGGGGCLAHAKPTLDPLVPSRQLGHIFWAQTDRVAEFEALFPVETQVCFCILKQKLYFLPGGWQSALLAQQGGRLCGWTMGLFPKDPKPEAVMTARGCDAASQVSSC